MTNISVQRVIGAIRDLSNQGSEYYFSSTQVAYRMADDPHNRPNENQVKGVLEALVEDGRVSRVIAPSGRFSKDEIKIEGGRTLYRAKESEEKR